MSETRSVQREIVASATAVICIAGLGVVFYWLFHRLALAQQEWDRALFLLSGIEAVGFAAAGYLFGSQVNRWRANNAEKRADDAVKKADSLHETVNKGKQLAANVLHAQRAASLRSQSMVKSADLIASLEKYDLEALADTAREVLR